MRTAGTDPSYLVGSRYQEHVNTRPSGHQTRGTSGIGRLSTAAKRLGRRSARDHVPKVGMEVNVQKSQVPRDTNVPPNIGVVGEESLKEVVALVAGRKEKHPRMLTRLIP